MSNQYHVFVQDANGLFCETERWSWLGDAMYTLQQYHNDGKVGCILLEGRTVAWCAGSQIAIAPGRDHSRPAYS